MNPLKKGLGVFKYIKNNKLIFFSLIILQILFLASISATSIKYQIQISENAQNIIQPLQIANYNSTSIEEGNPFMEDMVQQMESISYNYQKMIQGILKMILIIFCCVLLFNGLIWSSLNKIIKGGKLLIYWGRFILINIIFMIPLGVISYFLLKGLMKIGMEVSGSGMNLISWIFLISCYFMIIGFCLLEKRFKEIMKKIFLIGIKEIHWMLLTLMFVLGTILLILIFMYYTIGNLILMMFGILLLSIILVLGKLYLLGVVRELN